MNIRELHSHTLNEYKGMFGIRQWRLINLIDLIQTIKVKDTPFKMLLLLKNLSRRVGSIFGKGERKLLLVFRVTGRFGCCWFCESFENSENFRKWTTWSRNLGKKGEKISFDFLLFFNYYFYYGRTSCTKSCLSLFMLCYCS